MPDTQTVQIPDSTAILNSLSATGSDIDKQLSGVLSSAEKDIAQTTKDRSKTLDTIESVTKTLAEKKFDQPPPAFPTQGTPPKPPEYDPVRAFGSFASAFGIIASLATRGGLTSALNAAAAGMKAYRANDIEAYQEALKAYDENSKFAIDRAKFEQESYRNAIELYKQDYAKGDAAIRTLTSLYNDQTMDLARQSGMVEKVWDARSRLLEKADEHRDAMYMKGLDIQLKMQLADPMKKIYDEWVSENPDASIEDKKKFADDLKGGGGDAVLKGNDLDYAAEKYRRTGTMPPMGLGSTGAAMLNRHAIIAKGQELSAMERKEGTLPEGALNADYDLGGQYALAADKTSLASLTKMTDAAVSFETTAARNFDLALSLFPKGHSPDMGPWINKWIMTGETGTGDTSVPPYVTALLTGANEYAKIMSGSTGAQGSTVDSRKEAAERFSPYLDKGQIDGVVKVAKQDMENRKRSLTDQLDVIQRRIRGGGKQQDESDSGKKTYQKGDIIEKGGKKYKVIGGDPSDPDVELVK